FRVEAKVGGLEGSIFSTSLEWRTDPAFDVGSVPWKASPEVSSIHMLVSKASTDLYHGYDGQINRSINPMRHPRKPLDEFCHVERIRILVLVDQRVAMQSHSEHGE